MLSSINIAWLAGLLEGEGSFYASKRSTTPVIFLGMTDRDVVARAHALLGAAATVSTIHQHKRLAHHGARKPMYRFEINGGAAASWMMTLYPFLGERRRARVQALLQRWRTAPFPSRLWTRCMRGHDFTISLARQRVRVCRECAALRRSTMSDKQRGVNRTYQRLWRRKWRAANLEKARENLRHWRRRRLAHALLVAI